MFRSPVCPTEWSLTAKSLISFEKAKKQIIPACDWIFFSSKNAVRFYYQLGYPDHHQKVACVGEGTRKVLAKYQKNIDFVGTDVDTATIAKKFNTVLGKSTCLFPISDISKETIQSAIPKKQVFDLVVYHTKEKKENIDSSMDILVFTSPSNVRAYFKANELLSHQKIVAIGPSTAQQIKDLGFRVDQVSVQAGEIGMIDGIQACN